MRNKILAILLLSTLWSWGQIPNTATFTQQDVTYVVGYNNLADCFGNSVKGFFNPTYDNDSYAPQFSMLRLRDYYPRFEIANIYASSIYNVSSTGFTVDYEIDCYPEFYIPFRGIVVSTNPYPTLENGGIFADNIEGCGTSSLYVSQSYNMQIQAGTKYYVRAYYNINGENGKDIYSNQLEVVATNCSLPQFIASSYSNETVNSVDVTASFYSDGGCAITSKGFQWSTDQSFSTILGSVTLGSGLAQYGTTITGLDCGAHYFFRPWATNGAGTVYANNLIGSGRSTLACTTSPSIGDYFQGGIVIYVFENGDDGYVAGEYHGIIAATSDQSTGVRWHNGSQILVGDTYVEYKKGFPNTTRIISIQGAVTTSYAAGVARAYRGGGFTDWSLPSTYEAMKFTGAYNLGIGGFVAGIYWTSREAGIDLAQTCWPASNSVFNASKSISNRVRAIRYF